MPHPDSLRYTAHARRRLRERSIRRAFVKAVLREGEIIEDYPDDPRGASYLMLGRTDVEPLHVHAADKDGHTVVIAAYWPDPDLWSGDLRERL